MCHEITEVPLYKEWDQEGLVSDDGKNRSREKRKNKRGWEEGGEEDEELRGMATKKGIQQHRVDTLHLGFAEMPADGTLVEMLTDGFSEGSSRSHLHYW